MKSVSIPVKLAGAVLGAVLLVGIGVAFRNRTKQPLHPEDTTSTPQGGVPSCTGSSTPGQARSDPDHPHHSVTLSWNAAVPSSNLAGDAIKGYYVYRSVSSQSYSESNRVSKSPVRGTRCVDTAVEPRTTYFYVVKALTEGGAQSGYSMEIRAVVPFP